MKTCISLILLILLTPIAVLGAPKKIDLPKATQKPLTIDFALISGMGEWSPTQDQALLIYNNLHRRILEGLNINLKLIRYIVVDDLIPEAQIFENKISPKTRVDAYKTFLLQYPELNKPNVLIHVLAPPVRNKFYVFPSITGISSLVCGIGTLTNISLSTPFFPDPKKYPQANDLAQASYNTVIHEIIHSLGGNHLDYPSQNVLYPAPSNFIEVPILPETLTDVRRCVNGWLFDIGKYKLLRSPKWKSAK